MITNKQAGRRWQSVLQRQASADGKFVYAVRSTGIYCRPSCPARRCRRDQATFFSTPDEAERAGYRACRRCHPRDAATPDPIILRTCRLIESHLEDSLSLAQLSSIVGVSRFYLQKKFKRSLGLSPREYADACRFRAFKKELKKGPSVTAAVYAAGYGSSSRAYERTPHRLGMTPARYRQGGQHVHIRFATADCRLGRLLMAATDQGVCMVSLGADDTGLMRSLREEFPSASLQRDRRGLADWLRRVLHSLDGNPERIELPLDIRATSFQHRVWRALQRIPCGTTQSYEQIARAIGNPKAVRAVARACATNPVALVIPCHRVVRKSGAITGYRWGVERKRALLDAEKSAVSRSNRRRSPRHRDKTPRPVPA